MSPLRRQEIGLQAATHMSLRSACRVRVGAAIADPNGMVVSTGWNHPGPLGLGVHAEVHAINRAKVPNMDGYTIYVVAYRNNSMINSRPCKECMLRLKKRGISSVKYYKKDYGKLCYFEEYIER